VLKTILKNKQCTEGNRDIRNSFKSIKNTFKTLKKTLETIKTLFKKTIIKKFFKLSLKMAKSQTAAVQPQMKAVAKNI
jgi:cell fate regulator YaaT (PSP1 superfamily)